MKILVDEIPRTCSDCLFCGGNVGKVLPSREIQKAFTGCKLLYIPISFEIGTSTRLGNCPLKELS